jgi:DNA-binding response OmpR family regulator
MARILIVEDDPDIALGLEQDLRLEGYELEVVSDGQKGVDRAQTGAFDLILLDVMLPGKDGFQVCRELRHARLQMPIILLTAKSHEAEKILGLEIGADDYITKPFSPMELRARIKAALRRGGAADALEVFRFGEFAVDFERFELRRAGKPVDLTPIEFKLLAAFVRNRRMVLSRQQLLDKVWGRDVYVTDRVVDTHIGNLRKKIEVDPDAPALVVSVRGFGYRFDA